MARQSNRSGASTPSITNPSTTVYDENNGSSRQSTMRPQLRKNPHSGNDVSFANQPMEEEEDVTSAIKSPISPPISYNNMRSQSFSSGKVKLKPLLKKKSLDTPSIDLSKSMAENEELGIFTQPIRAGHTRSSSGVSMVTINSLNQRPNVYQYRHGQNYTPPVSRSRSRADSSDDLTTSYASVPKSSRTPPPLHIRTHSTSSNPRLKSSSQTHIDIPTSASSIREPFSPDNMGRSGRSSFDSVFRRRKAAEEDPILAAAIVREEWFARQAAKQRKRNEEEAKNREKADRRQEKLDEYARKKEEAKRSRSNTTNTLETIGKVSTLGSIKYSETKPGLPVDKELELIRAGIQPPSRPPRPRRNTNSTIKKKARGTKNAVDRFLFDLETLWIKFLHLIGVKKHDKPAVSEKL